jgi:hypothetical protein
MTKKAAGSPDSQNKNVRKQIFLLTGGAILSKVVLEIFLSPNHSQMKNSLKFGASFLIASGIFGFAGSAPANAAACPGGSAVLISLPLAYSCDQGGFTFNLTAISGFVAMDAISFSNPTATTFTYNVNSNSPWTSGSKTLTYSVTAPSGKFLNAHTASLTSSTIPSGSGNYTVAGMNTTTGVMTHNNTTAGEVDYLTNLASDNFTATLNNISGGGVQQITSTYSVTMPANGVPAPLPLLGAGAAFGFSRKLRRRIKLAA